MKNNLSKNATADRFFGENGFLGIDFTNAPELVASSRFSDGANIWRDYESGAGFAVETFPGFRRVRNFGDRIYGIFHFFTPSDPLHRDIAAVHAGTSLYLFWDEDAMPKKVYDGLACHESVGFVTADALWILDGTNYVTLFYDQTKRDFAAFAVENTYIPMTFRNGAPYEQRNALSDSFKEGYDILDPFQFSLETEGLLYEITDPEALLCEVMRIKEPKAEITIPSTVVLGGQTYTVVGVGARAFQNDNTVRRVTVQRGVQSIGDFAFNTCLSLEEVFLPSTVSKIGWGAFAYSPFSRISLGRTLKTVGKNAFRFCENVQSVIYEGTEEEFALISFDENNEPLLEADRVYEAHDAYSVGTYGFALNEPCAGITEAKLGTLTLASSPYTLTKDTVFDFKKTYFLQSGDVYVKAEVAAGEAVAADTYFEYQEVYFAGLFEVEGAQFVKIVTQDYRLLLGATLTLEGKYKVNEYATITSTTYRTANPAYQGSDKEAITGSTRAVLFDGRVFLTGNPKLPNTVFYSQRDLTGQNRADYFGICNFFDDGISNNPNTAMTALSDALLVYKKDALSDGLVYCHKGQDTGDDYIPRIYPSQSGIAGKGSLGQALNFADDAVFVSARGVDAIGTLAVNLERSVAHRSTLVDGKLLTESLPESRLCEWKGYLLLLCPSGHIYMADSRLCTTAPSGKTEYEWYYLDGVGSYKNDIPVYRYAENYPFGYLAVYSSDSLLELKGAGTIPFGSYEAYEQAYSEHVFSGQVRALSFAQKEELLDAVWSEEVDENGDKHYYLLSATTERTGGTFSPACAIASVGERLFVGTGNGILLCANTDKRGKRYPLNDTDENTVTSPSEIDRRYYSYDSHRFLSFVMTKADHGGVPHMTKSTVKGTTVLALKNKQGSMAKLSVHTDRGGWVQLGAFCEGTMQFVDFDMAQTVFATESTVSVAFKEKTKRFTYKKYALYSDEYQRPFGIRHLAYRLTVAGRIKNQ